MTLLYPLLCSHYSSDLPPGSHITDESRCAFGTYSYRLDGKVYGKRVEWLINKWLWLVVVLLTLSNIDSYQGATDEKTLKKKINLKL